MRPDVRVTTAERRRRGNETFAMKERSGGCVEWGSLREEHDVKALPGRISPAEHSYSVAQSPRER
jgi:hypothetical protein